MVFLHDQLYLQNFDFLLEALRRLQLLSLESSLCRQRNVACEDQGKASTQSSKLPSQWTWMAWHRKQKFEMDPEKATISTLQWQVGSLASLSGSWSMQDAVWRSGYNCNKGS